LIKHFKPKTKLEKQKAKVEDPEAIFSSDWSSEPEMK
jgi:hypothetical protein